MQSDGKAVKKSNKFESFLNIIEVVGNKLPDITILFLIAFFIMLIVSWILSHFTFNYALEMDVFSSGTLNYYGVNDLSGLRPAISLKYGTAVSGGDGSANSPYIIFTD